MTTESIRSSGLVLSMGEILIDLIVTDGAPSLATAETFLAREGGAPANVAVALARLGLASGYCGVAGKDPFGVRLREKLAAQGVDTSRFRLTGDGATTLAFAWKDARGDGHFWLLRDADIQLSPSDADAAGIGKLAALVVGSVSLAAQPSRGAIEHAVHLSRQQGIPVVFDVNLRPTLWPDLALARAAIENLAASCRLVKLSLDDARGLYGAAISPEDAIAIVLRLGPRDIVLTDGERGCWFAVADRSEPTYLPSFEIDAVEPTGAGDAFTAALIARLLTAEWSSPTADDVRFAAAAGALATTKPGAWEGLPSRGELDAFLATR